MIEEDSEKPPVFTQSKCNGCGECIDICPVEAISGNLEEKEIEIDDDLCVKCGSCIFSCEPKALV